MAPSDPSQRDRVVLHVLRCIGFSVEERAASAAGVEPVGARASLEALARNGLVREEQGVFGGWGLTDRGRSQDDEWLATELEATGARAGVRQAYDAFSALNPMLLKVCHDWQMRGVGGAHFPNDHSDARYDARVIDRLARVDGSVQPILTSLSDQLPRFATYRDRLSRALELVEAGEHAYFTDGLDSYHTVWFQLHEDLLTTLGIDRYGGS